jgi:LysR family transcriptional regulator, glycine cleavage system transcriptional activator
MVEDWSDVHADLLAPDVLVPPCSSEILLRYGPFRRPADFLGKALLHTASRPNAWPDWFEAFGLRYENSTSLHGYGHFFIAIEAAREGLGLALIPEVLIQPNHTGQDLKTLNDFSVESAGSYYLLC